MNFKICAVYVWSLILVACHGAPEKRIVGGDDALPGQIPYQAYLTCGGSHNCGAVIISERYALTGLRCVVSAGGTKPWPPQLFRVNAGSADLYSGGVSIVVEEITLNPDHSEFNTGIALLKLTEAFKFSDTIQPIALSKENPPAGVTVDVSGWGRIKEGDENMYRTLQLNEGEVLSEGQCSREIGKEDDQVFCLGHPRKNGLCLGDFGGPAVYQDKLVGIGAYILGECGSSLPDVFTSIAYNYDWIMENI